MSEWRGGRLDEIGVERSTGRTLVAIDPGYLRPAEVDCFARGTSTFEHAGD